MSIDETETAGPPDADSGSLGSAASTSEVVASEALASEASLNAEQASAGTAPAATRAAPTPQSPRGGLARVWNWFWRSDAMRAVMAPVPAQREVLRLRAHLAVDVARRTEDSPEPFEGRIDALLCDLYRQSLYWSRCALAFSEGEPSTPKPFAELDPALLVRAVPDAELRVRAEQAAESSTFQELAALPEEERVILVAPLRALALALLAELELHKRALEALWTQRLVRVGLLGLLVVTVAFVGLQASDSAEKAHDLAAGKPWRTSSAYGVVTPCQSPEQDCTQSPDFFFHTLEEQQPWLEIDLGHAEKFSAVRVDNRRDCCNERAVPLMVEISSDRKHWRQVARRETAFSTWLAKFDTVSARYVRLRIDRRESLHLRHVRVLP